MMKIAAVVLSAGASSRMGKPKQLLIIDGKPMIQHVFELVDAFDFSEKYCVVGANAAAISAEVPVDFHLIQNDQWNLGLSQSIRVAVQKMIKREQIDAVFFFLADQPFIQRSDIGKMLATYSEDTNKCVATAYGQQPGVPVIFPRKYFDQLLEISGDKGAKQLLVSIGKEVILVQHQDQIIDIDTKQDYLKIQEN